MRFSWLTALMSFIGAGLLAYGLYIPAKAQLAQILLERAWNQTLSSGQPARPWPGADTEPVGRLTVGTERYIVLRGATGESMAFGPALTEGLGQPVISAHRDTHFKIMGEVGIGDRIIWQTVNDTRHYRIAAMDITETPKARVAQGALILTTCWPLDGVRRGSERLVVTAFEVGVEEIVPLT